MVTSLLMIALLTGPYFFLDHVQTHLAGHPTSRQTRAAIGVAVMFLFTGVGHFAATASMVEMLPAWVPARTSIVYASGVMEIVLAVLVLVPELRLPVGRALIVMLVAFVPVNVYAAFVRAPMGGHAWGPVYLLIRVPLQAFIAGWIWWFLARPGAQDEGS